MKNRKVILLGLIAIAVSVALIMRSPPTEPTFISEETSEPSRQDELSELSTISRQICTDTEGMVVRIDARRDRQGNGEEFRSFFGEQVTMSNSQGSGTCIDDGVVITNYHVVAHAREILVTLNGEESTATMVGFDLLSDIALLQVDGLNLSVAPWGNSDEIRMGDFIWAIGNPFGLQRSSTFGIVSALNQEGACPNVIQEFLQTDAAVNPGGSGGPLFNRFGQVIGINTAILGDRYSGISFAIPSNVAEAIASELQASGKISRGWLGVRLADKPLDASTTVTVSSFAGGADNRSPAEIAGIKIDDVITSWNHTKVMSSVQLMRLIAKTKPGESSIVEVFRQGKELTLIAKVAERP